MCLLLIIIGVLKSKDSLKIIDSATYEKVEEYLMNTYEEDYYKILDFKSLKIGNYHLLFVDLFKGNLKLPNMNGDAKKILKDAIDYIKDFDYEYDQSDPSVLLETGKGNCQAMSIVLKSILDENGVTCNVMIDDNHAYNVVMIDDEVYTVDMANNYINLAEGS